MFDRVGRDNSSRSSRGTRALTKAGRRLQIEPLEGRTLLTASLAPVPSVTVAATAGYQVPLNGAYNGNTDPQTYTVSTDNPTGGVQATVATGEFWTVGVSHTSSGMGDPAFSGTMTFQLFGDLTPNSVAKIESLINGNAPFSSLTSQAQQVIYPGGSGSIGQDYYLFGGNTIHRIANLTPASTPGDFIVQGGSINHDGTGQVFATPYANETSAQLVFNGSGQLALANSGGTDTNDSQFFITTGLNVGLNGNYTIFGQLVAGQSILTDLSNVAVGGTSGTTPLGAVTITSSTLSTTNPDGVIHINAANATAGTQTNVTVTATDTVDNTQVSRTFPVLAVASSAETSATTTPPTLNPVTTPISTPANTATTFQLSATNPTGGALTYTVQGSLTGGAFNATVSNGTATVSSTGLVTVTPNTGYTGPINLVVGVQDGTDRTGTGTVASPANFSLQNVTVNVGSFPTAPTINPIKTPISASVGQIIQIPLSATNPSGGQLSYAVEGALTNGAFTAITNATASIVGNVLTVVPNPGTTGPIDLVVGVRDQTNRAGTGADINSPTNFSTENIVINVAQPTSTGAVRFIPDGSTTSTGSLVVTPLPRPSKTAKNTIDVTQSGPNVEVIVNGTVDLNQPAVSNVDAIYVYGSTANDRITIDPALTVPVELSGGTGGHDVLTAGGGPTREQGWNSVTVEKEGNSDNYLFGKKGQVTFVQGSGVSDVIFAGTPYHPKGHSKIRRIPPAPAGTFYTFSGTTLVKASNPYITKSTTKTV